MRTNGPLRLLAAAAADLDADDLDDVGDAALGSELRGLWEAIIRLQAQVSRRVAVFDERGAAARDGARSIRDWLRLRLRVDGAEAARQAAVAGALSRWPLTARAYLRGEISADHVAAIGEAGWMLDDAEMSRDAEIALVARARLETPGRVRRLARRLRERTDPRAGLDAYRRAREERWLDVVRTATGGIAVRGLLDPGDGELLLTALAAQDVGGDDGVTRTASQRHADALVAACRTALRADLRHDGDRPRVVVTVPLDTLRAELTRSGRVDVDEALLGSGEPVPAETARRLACDARVVPAVLGGASEPLDIAVDTETVSQGLRRALELRDRGCRFPGCDQPSGVTEAHLVLHWARDGSSTVDNTVLLCPHHHVLAHEGGWQVVRDAYSGEVRARRPDGTRLDIVSPPPD
jgi:uncharacterized protein DUF222